MEPLRPRDHALALLLAAHVVLVTVVSLGNAPAADGDGPLDAAWDVAADGWNAARTEIRKAHEVYWRCCGVRQGWRMFNNVGAQTSRVEIAVRQGDDWRTVYVERDGKRDWNRRTFDHYRWREYFNHVRKRKKDRVWRQFLAWLPGRIAADFPEADAVRVRVRRTRYPEPEQLIEDRGLRYGKPRKTETVEIRGGR
jgi:hypothetical protein